MLFSPVLHTSYLLVEVRIELSNAGSLHTPTLDWTTSDADALIKSALLHLFLNDRLAAHP